MIIIYGHVETGTDVCGIWTVGYVNTKDEAEKLIVRLKDEAIRLFQYGLANGFETGDSIAIANNLDPHAHYIRYSGNTPDIEYFFNEVNPIDEQKNSDDILIGKLQGKYFPRSIKYDEDCNPIGLAEDEHEEDIFNYYESQYLSNIKDHKF